MQGDEADKRPKRDWPRKKIRREGNSNRIHTWASTLSQSSAISWSRSHSDRNIPRTPFSYNNVALPSYTQRAEAVAKRDWINRNTSSFHRWLTQRAGAFSKSDP